MLEEWEKSGKLIKELWWFFLLILCTYRWKDTDHSFCLIKSFLPPVLSNLMLFALSKELFNDMLDMLLLDTNFAFRYFYWILLLSYCNPDYPMGLFYWCCLGWHYSYRSGTNSENLVTLFPFMFYLFTILFSRTDAFE